MSRRIYVDPEAGTGATIRIGNACYKELGPSDRQPDTVGADISGQYADCDECREGESWIRLRYCDDDALAAAYVVKSALPALPTTIYESATTTCFYAQEADETTTPPDPAELVTEFTVVSDCDDSLCTDVHTCHRCGNACYSDKSYVEITSEQTDKAWVLTAGDPDFCEEVELVPWETHFYYYPYLVADATRLNFRRVQGGSVQYWTGLAEAYDLDGNDVGANVQAYLEAAEDELNGFRFGADALFPGDVEQKTVPFGMASRGCATVAWTWELWWEVFGKDDQGVWHQRTFTAGMAPGESPNAPGCVNVTQTNNACGSSGHGFEVDLDGVGLDEDWSLEVKNNPCCHDGEDCQQQAADCETGECP